MLSQSGSCISCSSSLLLHDSLASPLCQEVLVLDETIRRQKRDTSAILHHVIGDQLLITWCSGGFPGWPTRNLGATRRELMGTERPS